MPSPLAWRDSHESGRGSLDRPTREPDAAGSRLAPRMLGIVIGAAVVAFAAQVAVPPSDYGVPLTLQPLAVLLVGGVLGAVGGVAALVLYLAAGAAGLPSSPAARAARCT